MSPEHTFAGVRQVDDGTWVGSCTICGDVVTRPTAGDALDAVGAHLTEIALVQGAAWLPGWRTPGLE